MTADGLELAVSVVENALEPGTDQDWRIARGTGKGNARTTAEHIGDCLLSYTGQLVAKPLDRYARFMVVADDDASPAQLLEFAVLGGRSLASVVRTSTPPLRYSRADRADCGAGWSGRKGSAAASARSCWSTTVR